MTKVVVLEKFKKNWDIGSVVTVKDGYARNYLIPNGKAKFATKKNIEDIKLIEENLLKKDTESKSLAENTANNINNLKFTKEIAAKENGELYGSLSVADIVSFLSENEITIQKKSVKLGNKIKTTGEYSVDIDLHPEVNCSLNIEILSPKTSS
ncbi:MAG: 50S ribosomal protein L9 [Alphaproteobacteria bacterium]|jgi:large subunit ribosomal protein L9|nr:50S ribosomal protein L9 [Alphaproteobacteria bacterium]MDB3973188.1 50S ribosomal protein L9 [Alphaproteobacteria bacterium]MDG2165507.1 50S ribosomal protein L9 [Alphaproteobacteria bacterium]|tara:strand:- start:1713 stop:2171 length:459 start_codon:yes stop_codon:yes gene_type:complete